MIKAETFGRKLAIGLRKLVGDAKAKHYEAGFRNSDMSLTPEGKDLVLNHLAEGKEVEAILTEAAEEIIEESKKECK